MALDDPLTVAIIVAGVILVCAIVILGMRRQGKKDKQTSEIEDDGESSREFSVSPFKVVKTIPQQDASHAKNELRILDLEREVLSDAIRRLYEAQAEGKITEQERERLAQMYKARMIAVRDAITQDESVVALHELETMQEDLMKLFSERFEELGKKIDELRDKTDATPIKEVTIAPKSSQPEISDLEEKSTGEEKAKRKRKPPTPKTSPRTEAEKRVEEIRAEVEKALDKLGQMEIES